MDFSQHEIEYYHNKGQMPDWMYYQLSDKPLWMKWEEQHRKIYENLRAREEAQAQREAEKKLEKDIETKVENTLEKALADLLKDFPGTSRRECQELFSDNFRQFPTKSDSQVKTPAQPWGVAALKRMDFQPLQVLKYIQGSFRRSWGVLGREKASLKGRTIPPRRFCFPGQNAGRTPPPGFQLARNAAPGSPENSRRRHAWER